MSKIKAHSILRLSILSLLYDQPYCGYELIQSINRITGNKTSAGSVYPFLYDLMDNKFLDCDDQNEQLKSKKVYTLTPEGKLFAQKSFRVVKRIFINFFSKCTSCSNEFFDVNLDDNKIKMCDNC